MNEIRKFFRKSNGDKIKIYAVFDDFNRKLEVDRRRFNEMLIESLAVDCDNIYGCNAHIEKFAMRDEILASSVNARIHFSQNVLRNINFEQIIKYEDASEILDRIFEYIAKEFAAVMKK